MLMNSYTLLLMPLIKDHLGQLMRATITDIQTKLLTYSLFDS